MFWVYSENGTFHELHTMLRELTSLSHSTSTWSYSERATKNMIDVTFSKQCIHFRRSDLWPPTSTILKFFQKISNYFTNLSCQIIYCSQICFKEILAWLEILLFQTFKVYHNFNRLIKWGSNDRRSNHLNIICSRSKGYSIIPVVGTRTRRISCSVGR